MKKIITIAIAALASVAMLASCGEPTPDPTPVPPTPTEVKVESVTLNKNQTTLEVNGSEFLIATINPANATNKGLKWSSSDDDTVMVAANGKIVGLKVGTATVTVASSENEEKKATCSVTVENQDHNIHVTSVTVSPKSIELDMGGVTEANPTVTVLPENATNKDVIWTSDSSSVLVDSTTGAIHALSKTERAATITATSRDNELIYDTLTVTVADTRDFDIHPESVTLEDTMEIDLKEGMQKNIVATVLPANAGDKRVTWTSSDPTVATVETLTDTVGVISATATGETVITATTVDGGKTDTCTLTVKNTTVYATGVSIKVGNEEASTAAIELNKYLTVTGAVLPDTATNKELTWSIVTEHGGDYINLSSTTDRTITILAKKLTTSPVVVRATAGSDSSIYKEISITVVDPTDVDRFVSFENPADYDLYLSHIDPSKLNSVEGLDKNANLQKRFFAYDEGNLDKMLYKVGDQGVFEFAPSGKVKLRGQQTQTEVKNIATSKALYKLNSSTSEFELVNLSDYFTIADNSKYTAVLDNVTSEGQGVGEIFKLVLTPDTSKYYAVDPQPLEFVFKMIHGYNVYTLAQLSLFDNLQDEWADYKTASGLGNVEADGGVVLHNDISITSDILPKSFIWTADDVKEYRNVHEDDFQTWANLLYPEDPNASTKANDFFVNSPRDYVNIFSRGTSDDDFVLEGNFFSINTSSLKQIAYMVSGEDTLVGGFNGDGSHSEIFGINLVTGSEDPGAVTEKHEVTVRNLSMQGNGGLAGGAFSKGGFIGFKATGAECKFENLLMTSFFTGIMISNLTADMDSSTMTADRLIVNDSYSSAYYGWSSRNCYINNSWFARSGGPLFILDEALDRVEGTGLDISLTYATLECKNVYVNNPVTGTEAWFQGHPGSAGLVQQYLINSGKVGGSTPEEMAARFFGNTSYAYTQFGGEGKTISYTDGEDSYCNFICLDAHCANFADNRRAPQGGHFTINNSANECVNKLDMKKVVKSAYYTTPLVPTGLSPLIFQSAKGSGDDNFGAVGYIAIDAGTGKITGFEVKDTNPALFSGDFMNVYLDPLLANGDPTGYMIGVTLGTYNIAL